MKRLVFMAVVICLMAGAGLLGAGPDPADEVVGYWLAGDASCVFHIYKDGNKSPW